MRLDTIESFSFLGLPRPRDVFVDVVIQAGYGQSDYRRTIISASVRGQCGKINIRETSKSARYVMYACTNTGLQYTVKTRSTYGTTTTKGDGDTKMYVRLITMLYDTGPLFTSGFIFNLTAYQTLTNESVYKKLNRICR